MGAFDERVATGIARLHQHAASDAVYQWDNYELAIRVTWGRYETEELTSDGTAVTREMPDALIADYAELLATRGVPKRGDRIVQNGITRQVLPSGDEPVYRWSGHNRQVLRIHTKIVSPVP
jgi:hypothetical protein